MKWCDIYIYMVVLLHFVAAAHNTWSLIACISI